MSATRVFVARMAGLAVFDPLGDRVGRVRDVVTTIRPGRQPARVVGMVVEVPGRRRVFVPMTRVTSIDAGQVISTGLVNLRRFEQRPTETLVLGELLDRTITLVDAAGTPDGSDPVTIVDVAIGLNAKREWRLARAYVRRQQPGRLRRRGEAFVVAIEQLGDLGVVEQRQGAANLLAAFEEMKAPDLAEVIHELAPKRRIEVASALDDERLADVLEELPEDAQVEILNQLTGERAADVLEAMQPDDAADLLSELPAEVAERLLALMDPGEAAEVRRLLAYGDDTAGGLMTPEPVVLPPDATIAEALARVRRAELSPSLAAAVFVCRPPLEAPTGRYLGMAHIQRMLREPPHESVGTVTDNDVQPLRTNARLDHVARYLATYNLVSIPIVDELHRLVGAVTVDDVLDHLLPDDWRDADDWPDAEPGEDLADELADVTDVTGEIPVPAERGNAGPGRRLERLSVRRGGRPARSQMGTTPRGTRAGLDVPVSSRRALFGPQVDPESFGRWSERFARFMGTAWFIVGMTIFVAGWLAWNTLTPVRLQFDPRDLNFTLLTLILSLQASYAAPLILLAQNRQADRDRVAAEQDRDRAERGLADTEYLAREMAALRIALGEVATRDFVRSELRSLLEELDREPRKPDDSFGSSPGLERPTEHR